jgi:hypothetical protein
MADKLPGTHSSEGGSKLLGITLPVIFGIAIIAVVVFGLRKPFEPTYLNPDFFFTKLQAFFTSIINYRLGLGIKLFAGAICAFFIGLDFYLFLRIREYEDEHADHVFHHAEDDERPTGMFGHVMNEATDLVKDTGGGVRSAANLLGGSTESFFNRVLYGVDDADFFEPDPADKKPLPPQRHVVEEAPTPAPVAFKPEPEFIPAPQPAPRIATPVEDREGTYKWRMIQKLMKSQNPSDWKLSIIEADTLLDVIMERSGFPGSTLGERLKNSDPGIFRTLSYAREAHGVRNRIAHEGIEFKLNERDARRTIQLYEEVFREFEYI